MFQTEHGTASYAKPTFRRAMPENRSYRDVLARALALKEVGGRFTSIDLGDSDAAGLEHFLRQYEGLRHELMLRRVRGETLGAVEDAVLHFLNAELEVHLPRPERRPADVSAAVQEAKLLLAELENADD